MEIWEPGYGKTKLRGYHLDDCEQARGYPCSCGDNDLKAKEDIKKRLTVKS